MVLMDVRGVSGVTDFFLMVTGTSAPHIKALADETAVTLKKEGVKCYRKSGTPESRWIAMDYLDVVVHIFSADTRTYYALEELWSDAERIE